jgi:hypothetical protein
MLDRERRVLSFSGEVAAVFGAERMRDSLGRSIQTMHLEHSQSKIDWMFLSSEDDEATRYASMLINVPETVLQLRIIRLYDADGVSGYCLILYDITELTTGQASRDSAEEEGPVAHHLVKLPVSIQGHIGLLDIDQVAFLRAKGHYTQACTCENCYFCNMSLGQLESRLPSDKFMRVHRSYIVNLAYASEVHRCEDQFVICMKGTAMNKIPVSRSNVPRLRQLLGV